jgi:hypothetical protein
MSENGSPREECLYCHSNNLGIADRPCPVCGTWKERPQEAKEEREEYFFGLKIDPHFYPAYP